MFQAIGRILSRISSATALVAGVSVALMMIQVSIDVVGRYVLNAPLPATIAIVSQYYMLFIVFLPLALPDLGKGHIAVDVVYNFFPKSVQRHVDALVCLICAAVFAAMTWASWGDALTKLKIGAQVIETGVAIPIWPAYFALPLGCLLIALVQAYKVLAYLFGAESGLVDATTPAPEATDAS